MFSVSDERVAGVLSAYAEPVGHDGERVFYHSQQDRSVKLPSKSAARPVGVSMPGRYRIHAVIADRALTRIVRTPLDEPSESHDLFCVDANDETAVFGDFFVHGKDVWVIDDLYGGLVRVDSSGLSSSTP